MSKSSKSISIFLLVSFSIFLFTSQVSAAGNVITHAARRLAASTLQGYFVSTSGSDANPGTEAQPWRTIRKAAQMVSAGSTVYVRGGIYSEAVNITRSGTQSSPIKFLAYPGETPVVDGASVALGTWGVQFRLSGNWIQASGFEVRNSKWMGVLLSGQHDLVNQFYVHHNQQNGILLTGDYGTAQNSRVYRNCLSNENSKASSWASGLTAARDAVDGVTDYAIIRNNTVWENWGEGLSSYQANGTLIEGNVIHDNYSTNIYISDSTNVIVRRNFIYMNPTSYVYGHGSNVGIMMGDEVYKPASANIQVTDNIVYHNNRNFYWWQGTQGGGMNNVLVANNTFVNSTGTADVVISKGSHVNSRFTNNLVEQDGSLPVILATASSGLSLPKNIYSKTPSSSAAGTGNIVADPKLAKTGSEYTADWYRLLDISPAINKASQLAEVSIDYFGISRGTMPDLGAVEK